MEIDKNRLDELRLGAITAMDGVWFMAVEEKYGLEAALELDVKAWKNYGMAIFKRSAGMLGIKLDPGSPPGMEKIGLLFETLCRVDGTESETTFNGNTCSFRILRCAWWDNLVRSGRTGLVPCEDVDNAIFAHYLQKLDPSLKIEAVHSRPRGDGFCEWIMSGKGAG
ncbi:MAG: L-2-amino-thiazoline-4-carboxylic acid hydrolase [Actinobacteria bacterium]|nr:L-2-amino-thiazoline-4-carboxylic acid hydrolase [Actinomycetota bacterium]